MKRYIKANESYNYGEYMIAVDDNGWWHIYDPYSKERIDGPFGSWIEAQNYIDNELS